MDIFKEIIAAEKRIRPYILKTPLMESRELGELTGGKVYLKLESEQYTGSFKARGSLNKILSLSSHEKEKGVITASTGNHALGFARSIEIAKMKGTVYLPENASVSKVEALKRYPVELQFHGRGSLATELYAKKQAGIEQKPWISPYNDPQIIGGQGTIAIELVEQHTAIDQVFITVGGGGLISGIGTYLKQTSPQTRIVACMPENSPEMALSLEAGHIVAPSGNKETLSDGSAGGLEEGSITFPICQNIVDESILVSENEIASAIKFIAHTHHKIIEGAAGVAVASLIKNANKLEGKTVVIIICGSNIHIDKFKEII